MLTETVLHSGRRAGMLATMIPMPTSNDRQCQLSMTAQVKSEFTICRFNAVRTMQHAAVLVYRNMSTLYAFGSSIGQDSKDSYQIKTHKGA